MNNPRRILEVYGELRRMAPEHVGSGDLLVCAASLVELFHEEEDADVHFELYKGGVPFDMRGVDVNLSDGGWQILCREWREFGMEWE
jgi:hypothetical protein